jgi:hypothetical protein
MREAELMERSIVDEDRLNKARLLKLENDLLYATERILPLVVNQALEGDVKAQKLILDRTVPPLKPVTPHLPGGLPADDVAAMLQALLLSICKGEVSPTIGLDVLNLLKQTAELREGATPAARAHRAEIAGTKIQIARLEADVSSGGSPWITKLMEKDLAKLRRQLEAMYETLE